jgi:hypothetical protein
MERPFLARTHIHAFARASSAERLSFSLSFEQDLCFKIRLMQECDEKLMADSRLLGLPE